MFRALPGLHRCQGSPLGPAEVHHRGPCNRILHEERRRGHGHRQDIRGDDSEGSSHGGRELHWLRCGTFRHRAAAPGRDKRGERGADGAAGAFSHPHVGRGQSLRIGDVRAGGPRPHEDRLLVPDQVAPHSPRETVPEDHGFPDTQAQRSSAPRGEALWLCRQADSGAAAGQRIAAPLPTRGCDCWQVQGHRSLHMWPREGGARAVVAEAGWDQPCSEADRYPGCGIPGGDKLPVPDLQRRGT
mmetsp:Transcript_16240/g.51021  ORF Transcript_16240/g.51021 Transcript_16240/m.51021 type:complete len:243 (+) Transcript_16240:2409-3137(+)